MHQLHRLLSLLLAITLVFGSATIVGAQDSPTPTPTPAAEEEADNDNDEEINIVDAAMAAPNLQTLVTALEDAGLVDTLSDDGPFTVFAPTDDAFLALPEGALDSLLADPEGALTDVLLYHVVSGEVLSGDLSDGMTVETLSGATLTISVGDDGVMINNANVILTDLMTSNGIVHVIDAVLLPTGEDARAEAEEVAAQAEQTVEQLLQEFTPSIEVRDQVFSVRDGLRVVVPELFVTENGWVVIHRDDAGSPGAVIGYTFVEAGPHYDVVVDLTEDLDGDTVLWAMLHIDAGEAGVYEFPGADAPVQLDGETVMAQFTALEPGIIVSNQTVTDNTVNIEGVVTAADTWLVIHRSEDGAPGEVLGYAPAAPGVTPNVSVELTGELSDGETLWAMLHYDLGVRGEFEFPGEDVPIRIPRGVVMIWFVVYPEAVEDMTVDATPTPVAEAEDTTPTPTPVVEEATPTPTAAAEMAAPAATPTPMAEVAPDMLPVTGASLTQQSNSVLPWLVVILGGMVAAGIAIFRRRMA
jgi:uncharacterized surface protein with fasciclin (FAS1) repeats